MHNAIKKKKKKERDGEKGKRREIGAGREGRNKKKIQYNLHKHGFSKFHLSLELLLSNVTMPTGYVYFSLLERFSFQSVTPAWSQLVELGTLVVAAWWRHHASQR